MSILGSCKNVSFQNPPISSKWDALVVGHVALSLSCQQTCTDVGVSVQTTTFPITLSGCSTVPHHPFLTFHASCFPSTFGRAVLIKSGVKSSHSLNMTGCHLQLNPILYPTLNKPQYLSCMPPSLHVSQCHPGASFLCSSQHLNRVTLWHWQGEHGERTGWKLCVLPCAVGFSGNRSDNMRLPHLKGKGLSMSLCVCSPCMCVGFVWAPRFPPTVLKAACLSRLETLNWLKVGPGWLVLLLLVSTWIELNETCIIYKYSEC